MHAVLFPQQILQQFFWQGMSEAALNSLKTSKNDKGILTSKQNKIFLAVSQLSLFQN